ncbi:MAG: ankyrin repeat domain-containing protein [Candidatus Marinimicrobia bacterium]|nr:ankyrin repeat domain-containing protein [Candidatus Neomarinimicrobiota bacterium]
MKNSRIMLIVTLILLSFNFYSCTNPAVIINSSKENNLSILKSQLIKVKNIDITDQNNATALWYAVYNGNYDMVKLLIDYKANVNVTANSIQDFEERPPTENYSALWVAFYKRHNKIVELLINNGAEVNTKGLMDWTPLTLAAEQGNLKMAKLLLEKGAKPYVKSYDPIRTLSIYQPLFNHDTAMVNLLLSNGIDPNSVSGSFREVLWHMGIGGTNVKENRPWTQDEQIDMMKIFFKHGASANIRNKKGLSAIDIAISEGNYSLVEFLIRKGAEIQCKTKKGYPLLFDKNIYEYPNMVKHLLARGCNVNEKYKGFTPLINASNYGKTDIIELLLKHGADINAKTKTGLSSILNAAQSSSIETVRLLIEHGANINDQENSGVTPLINAIANIDFDIAEYLIKKGADPLLSDSKGRSAVSLLEFYGRMDLIELIESRK